MRSLRTAVLLSLMFLTLFLWTGCARVPYAYSADTATTTTLRFQEGERQFGRGEPVPFVDGLGHYVLSLPTKLLLWNWSVDNHRISPETEQALAQYLEANRLPNVKVRINQYEPRAEWRRLALNKDMPGFWRFTLGVVSCAYYMILPGRLFGGDYYNPYTNTINIYSDHAAIVLHEGAHAKDFAGRGRQAKGWYAFLRLLPLVPLYQEAVATGDAIGYLKDRREVPKEKAAYKILYPAYCTYIAGEGLQWVRAAWWVPYAVTAVAVIPGHIVGRIKAHGVKEEPRMAADKRR